MASPTPIASCATVDVGTMFDKEFCNIWHPLWQLQSVRLPYPFLSIPYVDVNATMFDEEFYNVWQLSVNGHVHGSPALVCATVDVGTMFDEEFYNVYQPSVNGKV